MYAHIPAVLLVVCCAGAIMNEVVESMGHLNTGGTATSTHTHGMTDRL